jgi:peptidoglycan hydrolase CwlO-like protein
LLSNTIDSLRTENTLLQSISNSLQSDNSQLQRQIESLQNQIATLQSEYDTLQSNNSQLLSQKNSLQIQIVDLQSQAGTIQSQYSSLQSNNNQLQSQLAALQTQYNTLQSNNSQLQSINDSLQFSNAQLQRQIETLQNLIANLQSQYNTLQSNNTQLQSQLSTLQSQLSNATALIAQLTGTAGISPTYMDLHYVAPPGSPSYYFLQLSLKNNGTIPITQILVTLNSIQIPMTFTYLNSTISTDTPLPSYQTTTGSQHVTPPILNVGTYPLVIQASTNNGTVYTYQTTITAHE